MEQTNENYLVKLPDELKLKIFSYLPTFDVVQLCEIFNMDYFTFDRSVLKIVRLYKDYRCDLPFWNTFICNKIRIVLIRSLNINCIYWITANDLRRGLGQMPMLEHLYAVDTRLSLTDKDCTVYNAMSHLQSLAITVSNGLMGIFPCGLVNLYLHLNTREFLDNHLLSCKLQKLPNLKNLWIIDKRLEFSVSSCSDLVPTRVENLTVLVKRLFHPSVLNHLTLNRKLTFKISDNNYNLMCFGRCDDLIKDVYNTWNCENMSWNALIDCLKYALPFGKEATKEIIKGRSVLEIEHEELNVVHPTYLCSDLFKRTVGTVLLMKNIRHLKKLAINFCLAEQSDDAVEARSTLVEPLFKKRRVGVPNSLNQIKSKLEEVVVHSPFIEELELYDCRSNELHASYIKVTDAALSSISNLSYLKKLTLAGIPQHIDGQFLITICKSCKHLESLRITTASVENSSYHNNICLALPHSTVLKDFRYEFSYGSIDRIIEALNEMTTNTLQRLVLKIIGEVPAFPHDRFSIFLEKHQQLKFLYIILREAKSELLTSLRKTVERYKKNHDQVFVVPHCLYSIIPDIHQMEMLEHHTNVCRLNIFNDFVKE